MQRHTPPSIRGLLPWLLILPLTGLLMAGCEIAEPALPSFTTRLTVPLGLERLEIQDIVDDEDYLVALADGSLGFWISGDPDTVSLDLDLGADIDAQQIDGELGTFSLDLDAGTDFDFTLVELFPAAAALDGQTWPVPAFGFDTQSGAEDLADIESASLSAGTLTVTVANGLPVPISAMSGPDRLVLDLLDPGSGEVLVSVEFDELAPGAEAQRTADLAGLELPGQLAVRLAGGSPGSDLEPVLVDAQAAVAVAATFSDLEVTAAVAVVPAQSFDTSFSTPCQTTVTWPAVFDLDDQPLQLVIDLAGGSEEARLVDFAGHVVRAPLGETLAELSALVMVTSPGSGDQPVALAMDQGVQAEIGGGRIEFHSVTGNVPAMSYDLAPTQEEIDLPDELEGLSLCRARMTIELTSTAGLPAMVNFDLVGVDQHGASRSMQVQEEIEAAEQGRATTTSIVLDETNSSLVDFLNHMPTEITLSGWVDLGGDGVVGTVRRDDQAVLDWEILSPVEVIIESSQIHGDPKVLDLGDSTRELIEDHFGGAAVQLEVLNHLPVGVVARLLLGVDPAALTTDPLLVIGPVAIDAGTVGPGGGAVIEPRVCRPELTLTPEQTRLLATAGMHSLLEVTLPSTEDDPVRVLTTDYLTVQGLIQLEVEVNDNR